KETLNDFKRSPIGELQQVESSSLTLNRSGDTGKGHQERDTNYPHMKVKFPRWEDRDPTSWIPRVENFFSLSQKSR
ncbi:hypothetical protein BHE74_00042832, partial [Ensete ventricosum]